MMHSTKFGLSSSANRGLTRCRRRPGIQAILCRPDLLIEIEAMAMFESDRPNRRTGSSIEATSGGNRVDYPKRWRKTRGCCRRHAPTAITSARIGRKVGHPRLMQNFYKRAGVLTGFVVIASAFDCQRLHDAAAARRADWQSSRGSTRAPGAVRIEPNRIAIGRC